MYKKYTFKQVVIFTGGSMVALLILFLIFLTIFADNIALKLINNLKDQTDAQIELHSVSVSILPYFPSTSIRLKGVNIRDVNGEAIIDCEEMAFKISLFKLLFSNVDLNSIRIKDGIVHFRKDIDGNWNYNIFKQTDSDKEDPASSIKISIKEAILERIEFVYMDLKTNDHIGIFFLDGAISAKYEKQLLIMEAKGRSVLDRISIKDELIAIDLPLTFDLKLSSDLEQQTYMLSESVLEIGKVSAAFEGYIKEAKDFIEMDLSIVSENAPLQDLILLLPSPQADFYKQLNSSGFGNFSLQINGKVSEKQSPDINMEINLNNAGLKSSKLDVNIKDVEADINWSSKTSQSIVIVNLSRGSSKGQPIQFEMEYQSGSTNSLNLFANGEFPISLAVSFLGNSVEGASGSIQFNQVSISGNQLLPQRLKVSGKIQTQGSELQIHGEKFNLPEALIELEHDKLSIQSLYIEGLKSDMEVRGFVKNYLALFFASGKWIPDFQVNVLSEQIHLDKIIDFYKRLQSSMQPDQADSVVVEQHDRFASEVIFSAEKLNYHKMEAHQVNFRGSIKESIIDGTLDMKAFDGHISANINYVLADKPELQLEGRISQVNAERLFKEMDDFGQEFISSKHVSGNMDARFTSKVYWDESGELDSKKFYMLAGIKIQDGQLTEFPLLYDFSRFVKIDDLKKVRFASMQNFIEIRDGLVHVPVMFIQSNALNLTIQGEHSIDQQVNYHLKINAGQVLANKFKKHDPTLTPLPVKESGLFSIYYRIFGHVDKLNYKSERKLVQRIFEESERKKFELREKLINLFGPSDIFNDEQPNIHQEQLKEEGEEIYIEFQ